MQTVPSLIGTGTAIAAAASGLVFGQPIEPNVPTIRPSQHRRKISFDRDLPTNARLNSLPPSRAGTGSESPSIRTEASQHIILSNPPSSSRPPLSHSQRPSTSQLTSPKGIVRRRSLVRQREASGSTIGEGPRDSISSNGSWIKRFSIRRPLSQHGSLRSSVGPDSPSITFSYGSSAPMLSRPCTAAQPLPPNKLVKRSSSMQNNDPNGVTRSRSKSHLPTLRRPATSHQRSATLHQFRPEDLPTSPSYSFDRPNRQEAFPELAPRKTSGWISFFHSRTASIGGSIPSRLNESNPRGRGAPAKRITLAGDERQRVHLVKPRMVSTSSAPPAVSFSTDIQEESLQLREESEADLEKRSVSPETLPTSRTKRSLSMPFSSSGNWISRTSGSLRRPKRGAEPDSGNSNKRHVSAPSTGAQINVDSNAPVPSSLQPTVATRQGPTLGSAANVHQLPIHITHTAHRRNLSSPLPPLPRDSSFHVDLPRLGSPGGAPFHPTRQNQPSGSSTSSAAMSQLRVSPLLGRSSVIESSESDTRGFTSGDDDDADFKSDTMYDSLRTAASSRMRAVETPLESVYDESPPSTAKTKRLSIQDILGSTWDGDNKILEEDETLTTPIRGPGDAETGHLSHSTLALPRLSLDSSHNGVSLSARDFGRLSFDDDFDDDWAADDDAPFSPLSPPSHSNSLNSRGINPNVRLALASLSVNQLTETNHNDVRNDRPLSTLFDWSESSVHDKHEADGYLSRPRTASSKHELDPRGGRSCIRKVPTPAHVRSQSVPIVQDASDEPKPAGAKFGTWGLGTKTVSEDWDEDFEFGASGNDNDGKSNNNLFPVPESIRASQPSVRAHSGQIRELSLLVNDLKRLCRHGRDMDLLDGPQRALWKEAEGVIALASPDEDSMDEDHESNSSINFDALDTNDQLLDDDFDVASLSRIDAAFDGQEPMSKTAVVRERHSPKRRSVFSSEDDIFGGNWPLTDENIQPNLSSRPRTPDTRTNKPQDVAGVARSVMESMHRSIPNQTTQAHYDNKMHFDTNSLKVLVRRAGELRDSLSDLIRRAEQITQSPAVTPRHERQVESSPAFTRVFDNPGSSPPRRAIRSRGNNSIIDGTSPETSTSPMNRLFQSMTVS